MPLRAVFTGGGTLGSVTPLLAVAERLRELAPGLEAHWIGTASGPEAALVREAGMAFHGIAAGRLHRYATWRQPGDLWRVAHGFFQAFFLLGRLRPQVVASAGGFVAVPVVWAAWLRRIPVHVHQLDLRPGLANRLSTPFARSLSVSFEKSINDYRRPRPVLTGTPIRRAMLTGSAEEGRRIFGLDSGRPVVLVTGGGTGAARLNGLVRAAAPRLCRNVQILHLTGKGKTVPWPDAPTGYRQLEFVTADMRHAYAVADLVVTRAGIGALTELAALGKPSIVVPIAGTHQEENAAYFSAKKAVVAIDEKTVTPLTFEETALGLLADAGRRTGLAAAIRALTKPDAAEAVGRLMIGISDSQGSQGS